MIDLLLSNGVRGILKWIYSHAVKDWEIRVEMYRGGLDRFKKAQSAEPFGITLNSAAPNHAQKLSSLATVQPNAPAMAAEAAALPAAAITQVGGGQSTWQPPDWAVEPRPGVHYLEVLKDGQVLGKIGLDKRRHIFGRQFPTCDFVLDHQSVSRQHAAVVPHKNGSIFVIDLGSAHGTFVANERLTKDSPVELEVGQSLRFAASTRIYILRKNMAALFPAPSLPPEIKLLSPPDPSNEEAVLAYNTTLNRYGVSISDLSSNLGGLSTVSTGDVGPSERPPKKVRKARVAFRDQVGGDLVQVVGISDGADVDTEPGPIGVKEGSLVGKYESLVQITVIPKGKELNPPKEDGVSPKGVTDKLQQVLNKVKSAPKTGIYDDLYGDSVPVKVGSSWAYKSAAVGDEKADGTSADSEARSHNALSGRNAKESSAYDSDDLFGDDD